MLLISISLALARAAVMVTTNAGTQPCSLPSDTSVPPACRATFCRDREELKKDPAKLADMAKQALVGWNPNSSRLCLGWVMADLKDLSHNQQQWANVKTAIATLPATTNPLFLPWAAALPNIPNGNIIPIVEQLIEPAVALNDKGMWDAMIGGLSAQTVAQAMTEPNVLTKYSTKLPRLMKAVANSPECQNTADPKACDAVLNLLANRWRDGQHASNFLTEASKYDKIKARISACLANRKT